MESMIFEAIVNGRIPIYCWAWLAYNNSKQDEKLGRNVQVLFYETGRDQCKTRRE